MNNITNYLPRVVIAIIYNPWVLTIIFLELCAFLIFIWHLYRVVPRFIFVKSVDFSAQKFLDNSFNAKDLSKQELELFHFLAPFRSRQVEIIKRDEILDAVSTDIYKNEEISRAFMNGIIVLGLFGTISVIVSRVEPGFFDIKMGKEMLNIIPFAFIPSCTGLFLSLISSLMLSFRIANACQDAEFITNRIITDLPRPIPFEEVLMGVFSAELTVFLRNLPQQIRTAFGDIREDIQSCMEGLVSPYAESMRQATEQVPEMVRIVNHFGDHISIFSEKLEGLTENTSANQRTLSHLSQEVAEASDGLKQSVQAASKLFVKFEERYKQISETYQTNILCTTERFHDLLTNLETIHSEMIRKLNGEANSNYVNWLSKLNDLEQNRQIADNNIHLDMTTELLRRIDSRTHDIFLEHKGELEVLRETLNLISTDFKGYLGHAETIGHNLGNITTKACEISANFQDVVEKSSEISNNLSGFTDIDVAIRNLCHIVESTKDHMKKNDNQAQVLIRNVYDRLDRICKSAA